MPSGLRSRPVRFKPEAAALRVLAIVSNFKWSHTDYLVALGQLVGLRVVACGEVHRGAIDNAGRWGLEVSTLDRPEQVGTEEWVGRVRRMLDEHRPEVVHVMYYHHEALMPLLRNEIDPGCRLVMECRDPITALRPQESGWLEVERKALASVDGLIVVSRATAEYYQWRHEMKLAPWLVVPHAFARRTMGRRVVDRLSEGDGRVHLALVGTASADPQHSRYYANVIEQLTEAGVVVHSHFHDGPESDFYARLAKTNHDYFAHPTVPFREETLLSDLMARYDLTGVFHQLNAKGKNEGAILRMCLPTKAVSGWFHGGIPLVCFPHYGGILEYLLPKGLGFVVDELSEVARIPRAEIEQVRQRTHRAREFFSHEVHAARVIEFYRRLLELQP